MFNWRSLTRFCAVLTGLLLFLVLLNGRSQAAAPESANSLSSTYSQNFNSLANSGSPTWTNDSTLNGWYASHSGLTNYLTGNGSGNAGGVYSFGTTSTTERALGSIGSNTTGTILYGVRFVNDTGSTINSLTVSYTGEQWRNGGNTTAHKLDFSYQVGATVTSLTTGTWTDVDTLDFTGPIATATASALDGNAPANRIALSQTFAVTINAGQEIMLRWLDANDTDSDHGLAVDDLSVAIPSGDSAPNVSSTTPTNDAIGVAANANITINFNEAVTVDPNWFTISCDLSGSHSAAESGSGSSRTLDPTTDFTPGDNCTVTIDKDFIHDDDTDDPPDTMNADYAWSFTVVTAAQCNPTLTPIHTIQGSGPASPLDGSAVHIKGVVVGDFQGSGNLDGFFVQEEDDEIDANPLTSEGIFVFAPGAPDVSMGDVVRVSGTVDEFFNLTELTSVTAVYICGTGSVTAATLTLPFPSSNYLERFEGMSVILPQELTVTEVYRLGRGGLVDMTFGPRLYQPTQVAEPGPAANALQASNDLNRIIIDDGTRAQNPDPIKYPSPGLSASNTLRGGDTATGIVGVLTYSNHGWAETPPNDAYRVHPTTPPVFEPGNLRPAAPNTINGDIRVASFNVLNYFNGNGLGGGFPTSRGADSPAEFARQRAKIIEALVGLDADVIGLMELENDYGAGSLSAIQDLVNGINAEVGAGTYDYVDPGVASLGGDEIAVGLLYNTTTVSLVGTTATTSAGAFSARNRQPLAQSFSAGGEIFTVVVNHFKSKGSDCDAVLPPFPADPDTGDGQGNCNLTRVMAAQHLLNWLATDPTGTADPDILIIGDLNSYAREDPMDVLEAANYVNLVVEEYGADGDYSYVFDGQWGSLDHAMASASMTGQVAGVTIWHINADEPIVLDYNTEFKSAGQQTSLYSPDEYRSSDHDPVIIGLQLGAASDFSDLERSYGVAWHIDNDSVWLGDEHNNETTFSLNSDNGTDDGVAVSGGNWSNGTDGASLDITVNGSGNGCLYAWVDWNGDGKFDRSTAADNLEYAIRGETTGTGTYTFDVPDDTFPGSGPTLNFAVRVRLYQNCSSGPTGIGLGGESEDYIFSFSPTAVTMQGIEFGRTNQALALAIVLLVLLALFTLSLLYRKRTAQ